MAQDSSPRGNCGVRDAERQAQTVIESEVPEEHTECKLQSPVPRICVYKRSSPREMSLTNMVVFDIDVFARPSMLRERIFHQDSAGKVAGTCVNIEGVPLSSSFCVGSFAF